MPAFVGLVTTPFIAQEMQHEDAHTLDVWHHGLKKSATLPGVGTYTPGKVSAVCEIYLAEDVHCIRFCA